MKCTEAKQRLVERLYNEFFDSEEQQVRNHLAGCASCRSEWEALEHAWKLLNAVSHVDTQRPISVASLYETAVQRSDRGRRRWRACTAGVALLAAVILIVVAGKLRFEMHETHLTLAWDTPPTSQPTVPTFADPWPTVTDQIARLDKLNVLATLTAREILSVDQRQSKVLVALKKQVQLAQDRTDERLRVILKELSQRHFEFAQFRTSGPDR